MYSACVLNVLIGSPSDTADHRQVAREAIRGWNDFNSSAMGVVLLPVLWEEHATPELGTRPQGILNKQLGSRCDMLVAMFWTRLGTPTGEADSGTVEEIREFRSAGKPVLVYFSEAPVGAVLTLDTGQLDAVKSFRRELQEQGIVGTYTSEDELRDKVRVDLTRTIERLRDEGRLCADKNGQSTTSVDSSESSAIEGYRQDLRGWVAKWQVVWHALANDPSIDKPKYLMGEVHTILLELVRVLTTLHASDELVTHLSEVIRLSSEAQAMNIFMDGGRSFGAMRELCAQVMQQVAELADRSWS